METLKKLSPQWWGAIAAAVAAGASVFSNHRILGGLALGAGMLYVAKRASEPCCAACAGEGDHASEPEAPFDINTLFAKVKAVMPAPASSCPDCVGGTFS
jgi:hypothetical protein